MKFELSMTGDDIREMMPSMSPVQQAVLDDLINAKAALTSPDTRIQLSFMAEATCEARRFAFWSNQKIAAIKGVRDVAAKYGFCWSLGDAKQFVEALAAIRAEAVLRAQEDTKPSTHFTALPADF